MTPHTGSDPALLALDLRFALAFGAPPLALTGSAPASAKGSFLPQLLTDADHLFTLK